MDYKMLKKLVQNESSLSELLEFSYDCTKPYVNQLGSPKGYFFQRQVVSEAYLAFLGIENVSKPYELLSEWSDFTGIPECALEAYLDLITINFELVRNSPHPLEALKEMMRNA